MPLLEIKNLNAAYGEIPILKGINWSIGEGELIALMGPNGAGKSTLIKAMVGLVRITKGEILLAGTPIHPRTEKMAALGVSYVPQGRQIFSTLTVEQNLELGGYSLPNHKEALARFEVAFDIFPFLKDIRRKRAGALSGGQQQMLAVARGLMPNPKLLLLDEPTLGLAPKMVGEMFEKIREINQRLGMAVCVVEHNIKTLLTITHRATILRNGEVFATGTPAELDASDALTRVFLAHAESE